MDAHYGELNRLTKELRRIFFITSNVMQIQNQWNWLMVLTYLGTLDPIYSSGRLQIMRRCVVSTLQETYHFLKNAITEVMSDITTTASNRSAGWRGGRPDMEGRGGNTGGRLGGRSDTRGGRRGRRDGSMVYCHYCKKPNHTKYQHLFWKGYQQEVHTLCHYSRWWAVTISVWVISDIPAATEHAGSVFLFLCHSRSNS